MTIYLVLVGILVTESALFFDSERFKKGQKITYILTIILIALIAGGRGMDVGHDTGTYGDIFERISKFDFGKWKSVRSLREMEQGYIWLNWIFSRVINNYSWFLILVGLFEFAVVGRWIWTNSKRPFLSLTVFICMFYTFFLTGIRQSIAFSILLLAFDNVKKKQLIRFLIKVFLASLFHQTAWVFLFAYPLYRFIKTGRIFMTSSLVLLPALYMLRNSLFAQITAFFEKYSDFGVLEHGDAITYTAMLALICIVAMMFKFFFPTDDEEENKSYTFLMCMVMIALLIMPFVGLNGSVLRVAMYFSMFVCLLMVKLYDRINETGFKFVVILLTVALVFVLFVNELNGSSYIYEFVGWDKIFR